MDILVVGANRQIGRHTSPLLKAAGQIPRAMVRNNNQRDGLEALDTEIVEVDLEMPLGYAVCMSQACIFVAGSDSKIGPEKTIKTD